MRHKFYTMCTLPNMFYSGISESLLEPNSFNIFYTTNSLIYYCNSNFTLYVSKDCILANKNVSSKEVTSTTRSL
jgi:hypothetical protein